VAFIFTLAKETGWSEDTILDLPMTRSLKYYHAALWSAGAWTVRDVPVPAEQLGRLFAFTEEEDDD
jgi:hypothetical protein